MNKASKQRIYLYADHLKWLPKTIIPIRTVWGVHHTHPFHTWGYVKLKGIEVPVQYRNAGIWHSFDMAIDTDWAMVAQSIRGRFERDLEQ